MRKISFASILALTPFLAFAETVEDSLSTIGDLITSATPIVVALALLYFFWGLATFILSSGDADKREKSRGTMIWGIVALFIIVSVWGLIGMVQQSFGLSGETSIDVPTVDLDN